MIRISRTPYDFRAMTAAGAHIATFQTADQAARWVEAEAHNWPGCRVERVRVATTVETIHVQHSPVERAA